MYATLLPPTLTIILLPLSIGTLTPSNALGLFLLSGVFFAAIAPEHDPEEA